MLFVQSDSILDEGEDDGAEGSDEVDLADEDLEGSGCDDEEDDDEKEEEARRAKRAKPSSN